jgi:hypothetical protein
MRRHFRVFVEDHRALLKLEGSPGQQVTLRAYVNEQEQVVINLDHGQMVLEPYATNEVRISVRKT